jgi:hypothetical protein
MISSISDALILEQLAEHDRALDTERTTAKDASVRIVQLKTLLRQSAEKRTPIGEFGVLTCEEVEAAIQAALRG